MDMIIHLIDLGILTPNKILKIRKPFSSKHTTLVLVGGNLRSWTHPRLIFIFILLFLYCTYLFLSGKNNGLLLCHCLQHHQPSASCHATHSTRMTWPGVGHLWCNDNIPTPCQPFDQFAILISFLFLFFFKD